MRHVDHRIGVTVLEVALPHGRRDADDRQPLDLRPLARLRGEADAPANWILARQVHGDEALVDDGALVARRPVQFGEG